MRLPTRHRRRRHSPASHDAARTADGRDASVGRLAGAALLGAAAGQVPATTLALLAVLAFVAGVTLAPLLAATALGRAARR